MPWRGRVPQSMRPAGVWLGVQVHMGAVPLELRHHSAWGRVPLVQGVGGPTQGQSKRRHARPCAGNAQGCTGSVALPRGRPFTASAPEPQ